VAELGWTQISDKKVLEDICCKILKKYPEVVKDYKAGQKGKFKYFVGLVMKETDGKANPQIVSEIMEKKLTE